MKRARRLLSVCGLMVFGTTGCFHQVVQTGLAPSQTVVSKPWVSTWMWGLVAAQPIDMRSECRSGVATIETQQSFANGLVGALTFGIWAPQSVKVTCAAGRAELPAGTKVFAITQSASEADKEAVVRQALAWSVEHRSQVAVTF